MISLVFDADISKAICDKLGYELKIEDMSFETILASVNSGKADFGAAGMTLLQNGKKALISRILMQMQHRLSSSESNNIVIRTARVRSTGQSGIRG